MTQIHGPTKRAARAGTALALVVASALACVSAPGAPHARHSALVGHLRLVPREGTDPSAGSYGAIPDAPLVDYSTPGFAVVYLDGEQHPGEALALGLEVTPRGPVIAPELAAIGAGGELTLTNHTAEAHVVSCPEAGLIARIPRGQTLRVPVRQTGPLSLFLLDRPETAAQVFVAPGPYAVVSASGDWELRDVSPGPHELRTWHPRFAATARPVTLAAGQVLDVQLELGVQRGGGDE